MAMAGRPGLDCVLFTSPEYTDSITTVPNNFRTMSLLGVYMLRDERGLFSRWGGGVGDCREGGCLSALGVC